MQRPLLTNTSLCSDNCAIAALQTHLSRTAPWQDTPDIMNKKQLKTGPAGINPAGPVCFFRNAETDAGRHQKEQTARRIKIIYQTCRTCAVMSFYIRLSVSEINFFLYSELMAL